MGKPKKPQQEVVIYGMSIHFGVCAGPVEYMSGLIVDEKPAWPTNWPKRVTGLTQLGMALPDLFGGEKKEGGLVGLVSWLPGAVDQVMPENLASKFGRTSATMPAYRGIASVFFSAPAGTPLPGFAWRWNTPFLPGVWVGVARASEALEIPHARIWRGAVSRRSIHIALDHSGSMAGTRLATMQAAVNEALDILSTHIAAGGAPIDIRVSLFGIPSPHISFWLATPANIESVKDFVDAIAADASNTNFVWAALNSVDFFTTATTGPTVGKRINIIVTDGEPTGSHDGSSDPADIAAGAAATMNDLLDRTGGTFNTAAGTAVDCYGVNIELLNTVYTAYLDNTPEDGVPIVSGSDSSGLRNIILSTIFDQYDSNPAHIIYECLTNPNWGMGAPASAIDVVGFEAASVTLYEENFGLSMMWVQQSSIEDFISEVLDHIQATLFVNPRTGLLSLKLIRNDYSIPSLPVFTPDNSVVTNFSRKLWGETVNEIVVTWTNPDNEEEETIVAQDLANIEAQGGVISDSRNYYGVRRSDLAARLAHRDLRSASTPLAKCDLEVNRTAWDLLPGDCCVLDSPEDGIDSIVMRVGPVDYGKPGDSTVRTSLVEDVFSLALADYSEPPESLWVDTSESPSPADHTKIVTLPYYLVTNLIDASIVAGVDYPEVFAAVLASEAGQDTNSFELYGQETNAAGVLVYANFGTKTIASRATLASAIPTEVETVILSFPDRTQGNGPVVGGLMLIEGANETVSEICLVSDLGVSGYTFLRGVLDTIPRAWPIGTPVWFVDDNMEFTDDTIRSVAETVNFKALPTTSRGTLAEASAPVSSAVMTARPHLPLRPADVMINGDAGFAGPIDCIGVDPIPVTWARRNRTTETAIIKAWDDGDVTPEAGQTTTITLTNLIGTVLHAYSGITGTSYDIDPADFAGEAQGYVVVSSERDGLDSLQAWRVHVWLLASIPIDVAVTGVEATGAVGSVTVATPVPSTATVTGVEATASIGTVTVSVPADPYFTDVVLLVGANGADASTAFVDESPIARTLTAVGNAQIDTAQFKFGTASLLLDGNGDRITAADSMDWDFGNGAFTVEAWVRFAVTETAANYLVSQWNSADNNRAWGIQYSSNAWLFASSTAGTSATTTTVSNAWTQSGGTWFHFACTRDGAGDVRMFINGTQIGTTQARNVTIFDSNQPLWIGAIVSSTPANDFNGWIDELRITKGIARYTSGFTVPAAAFPRSFGGTYTYWNPGNRTAVAGLINGLLKVTNTSGGVSIASVSATHSQASGKYYWEYTFTTMATGSGAGIAAGSITHPFNFTTTSYMGTCGLQKTGNIYVNSSIAVSGFGTIADGSVIGVAFDATNQLIWFRVGAAGNWNNSGSANPATGTGGVSCGLGGATPAYPVATLSGNDNLTANFGDTAFTGAVPSGFTSGFPG